MRGQFRRIHEARRVIIHFGLASSPANISLQVNKTEIHRLIRDDGLDLDDLDTCNVVYDDDGTMHIFFAT